MLSEHTKLAVKTARSFDYGDTEGPAGLILTILREHGAALIAAVELAEADHAQWRMTKKRDPLIGYAESTRKLNAARDAYRAAKGESND